MKETFQMKAISKRLSEVSSYLREDIASSEEIPSSAMLAIVEIAKVLSTCSVKLSKVVEEIKEADK